MKKKALAIALMVSSGTVLAGPLAGNATPARAGALNVFPNLGTAGLLAPLRTARAAQPATPRATRFADALAAASNNRAMAANNRAMLLANAESRGLPGLEALRERVANRGTDRPALFSRDGRQDGDSGFDFDSSTSTNSDGSKSRTFTTSFNREGDASRTTKAQFTDNDASRTVDTANKSSLETSFTLNRDPEAVPANGRALRLGRVEMTADYQRDASRKVKIQGTESSDSEKTSSTSTDYSGTFDSSRPFDGSPFDVNYRFERKPANGETVVRSSDTPVLTPAGRRDLRAGLRDGVEQRQQNRENRQEQRADRRQDLASNLTLAARQNNPQANARDNALSNAEQRQQNRAERREDAASAIRNSDAGENARDTVRDNAEQRQQNREDRQEQRADRREELAAALRNGNAGDDARDTVRDNAEQRQQNRADRQEQRADRREELASAVRSNDRVETARNNAEQRQQNRADRQEQRAERREDRLNNN